MATVLNTRNRRLGRVVGFILVVIALWVGTAHIITFEPFTLHRYEALPNKGCPNILLDALTKHYSLVVPPYMTVGPYRLKTNWERVDGYATTELQEFRGSFEDAKRGEYLDRVSPHLRAAPPEPGTWRIYSEYIVSGTVLGWPRQQVIRGFRSNNVYTAVPPGMEGCSE